MGLLKLISKLCFQGKAHTARIEQNLAQAAQGLLNADASRTRNALMDIADAYKKRDNDFELAEAVMYLANCYGNVFGKDKEVSLILDMNQAAQGTHLETLMLASLSQDNPFTKTNTFVEGIRAAQGEKAAAAIVRESLNRIMRDAGLRGLEDQAPENPGKTGGATPETPVAPMSASAAKDFCRRQKFFL